MLHKYFGHFFIFLLDFYFFIFGLSVPIVVRFWTTFCLNLMLIYFLILRYFIFFREKCGQKSLKKLMNDIEAKGIKGTCEDNPR